MGSVPVTTGDTFLPRLHTGSCLSSSVFRAFAILLLIAVSRVSGGPLPPQQQREEKEKPQQQDAGEEEGARTIEARLSWFLRQRAYPDDTVKTGSLLNALGTYRQARKRRAAASVQSAVSGLNWAQIGPMQAGPWSGRINALAVDPADGRIAYAGAAGGGVWKTADAGGTWRPLTDNQPSLSTGALAIDPGDPDILYWGTGEANQSVDSYGGAGMLKSTDAGLTWSAAGLSTQKQIAGIAVDPLHSDNLLAAAHGGIYRSTDGGSSWLATPVTGPAWDVAYDPIDPSTCYAAGSGSLYKSMDGGKSWRPLNTGTPPSGDRIVIGLSASSPSTLYALTSGTQLYKSTDGGASWSTLSIPSDLFAGQGWYDIAIGVSPVRPNVVLIGGQKFYRSTDGGATWTPLARNLHADAHALRFGPAGSPFLYAGHDGGVGLSTDDGATWTNANGNLAITQFYSVGLDVQFPSAVWGGTQDNGTQRTPGGPRWTTVIGGDGGIVNVDYTNSSIVYCETQNGHHFRTMDGVTLRPIQTGIPDEGPWVTPVVMDPGNPAILYTSTRAIYKSTNRGDAWKPTAASYPWDRSLVEQLAVVPKSEILFASAGASFYRSTDGGVSWSANTRGLPGRVITSIVPDPADPRGGVYVTLSGTGSGHIFKSADWGGGIWVSANGDFPEDLPANSLVLDRENRVAYIGTDLGVWSSTDEGSTWAKDEGFPNAVVVTLAMTSDRQLVAATHGRSMFRAPLPTAPSLSVLRPQGGEVWAGGSIQKLSWASRGVARVGLDYSTDGGASWRLIAASTDAAAGGMPWTIPQAPGEQIVVRVSDASNPALADVSDAPFIVAGTGAELAAPALLAPADGSPDQPASPLLRWGLSSGASYYRLQVSGDPLFLMPVAVSDTACVTSKQIPPLAPGSRYFWRVRGENPVRAGSWSAIGTFSTRSGSSRAEALPGGGLPARLGPNVPNPFNPSTTLSFTLPEASRVRLAVYTILGEEVATLVDGDLEAGAHTAFWNGSAESGQAAGTGIYVARLVTESLQGGTRRSFSSIKMLLVR